MKQLDMRAAISGLEHDDVDERSVEPIKPPLSLPLVQQAGSLSKTQLAYPKCQARLNVGHDEGGVVDGEEQRQTWGWPPARNEGEFQRMAVRITKLVGDY